MIRGLRGVGSGKGSGVGDGNGGGNTGSDRGVFVWGDDGSRNVRGGGGDGERASVGGRVVGPRNASGVGGNEDRGDGGGVGADGGGEGARGGDGVDGAGGGKMVLRKKDLDFEPLPTTKTIETEFIPCVISIFRDLMREYADSPQKLKNQIWHKLLSAVKFSLATGFETIASDEEKKTKMSGYEVYFETDLFLM